LRERETFLAEHNLYVSIAELKRIKQAIRDGRLWEHLEMRVHTHPTLLTALKKLRNYEDFIEKQSPTVKRSGLFFFSSHDIVRPEIGRYRKLLITRYSPPKEAKTLVLVPQTRTKPFHKAIEFHKIKHVLNQSTKKRSNAIHVAFYAAPFGVIPLELDEVYPLSQHEISLPLDKETIAYVAKQVAAYIQNSHYKKILLLNDPENWNNNIKKTCRKTCLAKGIRLETINTKPKRSKNILTRIEMILKKKPSE
jgi:7-cyano-7-deazaguanine tRNA-ribosyltransferase